jgi:hypothetical protein
MAYNYVLSSPVSSIDYTGMEGELACALPVIITVGEIGSLLTPVGWCVVAGVVVAGGITYLSYQCGSGAVPLPARTYPRSRPISRPFPITRPISHPAKPRSQPSDCGAQWAEAYDICQKEFNKPNPSRQVTGGHRDLQNCAKGFVSEACGGNSYHY